MPLVAAFRQNKPGPPPGRPGISVVVVCYIPAVIVSQFTLEGVIVAHDVSIMLDV